MGRAIIQGLAEEGGLKEIVVYDTSADRLHDLPASGSVRTAENTAELTKASDFIILAVKPPIIPKVLKEIDTHLLKQVVISVAAGVTIQAMEEVTRGETKLIRAMPNTPALARKGMTVISAGSHCSDEDTAAAEEIFSAVGKVLVMPESLMDAVTGVSGSGPAYVFTFIQAMADGAVKMGIPREQALELASQTVAGAAGLVLETGKNPLTLRDMVTSPGGTTIDAVHILEKSGFSGIVMDAIEAAAKKSHFLGRKK